MGATVMTKVQAQTKKPLEFPSNLIVVKLPTTKAKTPHLPYVVHPDWATRQSGEEEFNEWSKSTSWSELEPSWFDDRAANPLANEDNGWDFAALAKPTAPVDDSWERAQIPQSIFQDLKIEGEGYLEDAKARERRQPKGESRIAKWARGTEAKGRKQKSKWDKEMGLELAYAQPDELERDEERRIPAERQRCWEEAMAMSDSTMEEYLQHFLFGKK